jgi:hypothetical protein
VLLLYQVRKQQVWVSRVRQPRDQAHDEAQLVVAGLAGWAEVAVAEEEKHCDCCCVKCWQWTPNGYQLMLLTALRG